MFTKIVVGTDDSPNARQAVETAGELAGHYGIGEVHVVTGYHPLSTAELAQLAHELPQEFRMELSSDQAGVTTLATAERQLRAMGVKAITHPVPTNGAEAVLAIADEVGADLVVVGSRGQGARGRLVHGSVSTKIVHHARCSVLVVHQT